MDPTLYDEIRAMRTEQTDRHLEVVQRLTALEVTLAPMPEIEARVKKLEGWRNMIAGALVVVSAMWTGLVTYIAKSRI